MAKQEQVSRIFGSADVLKQTMSSETMVTAINDSVPSTMSKYLTPERVLRILTAAAAKTPGLLKCTVKSLCACVIDAVQLGLEPGGPLGHAYLVPFWNKRLNAMECTLIIGYQGYIALARRSGELESVFAMVIYSRDRYQVQYGDTPKITHEPYIPDPTDEKAPKDRGEPVAGYCVARFKDGGFHMEVMTFAEIEAIRGRSKADQAGFSPWRTDWEMMARKTVIRRARHYWPLSVEMASAFEADDRSSVSLEDAMGEARANAAVEASKTERLKAELTGKDAAGAHAAGRKADPADFTEGPHWNGTTPPDPVDAGSGGNAASRVQADAEPQRPPEPATSEDPDFGPPTMTAEENAEAVADVQGEMGGAGF